jgi:ABC-type phosphate transport system substrate-binding protein
VVAAASVLALVFAGSGAAGVPAGQACNTDGQVNGGGATLQVAAQQIWIQGYTNDICGTVGPGGPLAANPGVTDNTAVFYNGTNTLQNPPQTLMTPNGSGAGRQGLSCRAWLYGGSDTPYDEATLTQLDGNPGKADGGLWYGDAGGPAECPDNSTNHWSSQPYQNPFYGGPGDTYPFIGASQAASDQPATMMSFPVTGTAVAIGAYFGVSGTDSHGCPAAPTITNAQMSSLFNGTFTNWPQLGGAFTNCFSGPSGSTPLPITRVVRQDSSGTTQNFKNYLQAIDPSTVPACATGTGAASWTTLFSNSNNTVWPGQGGGTCSPIQRGTDATNLQGNLGVLDFCAGGQNGAAKIVGAVCYADLPDFENPFYQAVTGFDTVKLPNPSTGLFVNPFNGSRARCDYSGVATPGGTNDGAVGLSPGDNWGIDNSPSHADLGNQGNGWPICAMTWDLVYSGTSQDPSVATNPFRNPAVNNDMRRTLYSYMLYILGAGQQDPTSDFYQSLPQGLLNSEIAGFQAHY